jgi:hypothetical protein
MTADDAIDVALRSANPLIELLALTARYAGEGYDSTQVLAFFEAQRKRLREAGREADEDVLTDAMDFIAGWCVPHMKVFDRARDPNEVS